MELSAWPRVRGDLASARRSASAFLDSLSVEENGSVTTRQNWAAAWAQTADAYCQLADLNISNRALAKAKEACLSALTAFEIARRLSDVRAPQGGNVSAKVEAALQRFGLVLGHQVERVKIASDNEAEFLAWYLPAGNPNLCTPAVICISSEDESGATLLGRLLPAVINRGISVLVVSHEDVAKRSRGQSEVLLSQWLDYLSVQPDVERSRIGVFGDGQSAALASDFAAYDRRIAAAVCDGGLWTWARTLRSIGWMTSTADIMNKSQVSAHRLRLARQMSCPILVIASGRGVVSVLEAAKLQADCIEARIDLEVAIPQMLRMPEGDVDNFITSDNCIFRWLERKLACRALSS